MRTLLLLPIMLATACSLSAPKTVDPKSCMAAREYITTMEYIREQKDFALNEKQSRELANQVSTGCTGASKRFIGVTNLLVKAGLPSQKSLETGIKYALSDDDSYSAFITVFKSAYLESLLDLDLNQSLDIAVELSQISKENKKLIEKEFTRLVEFCVNRKSLDLPLLYCAKTAARVVKSGEGFKFNIGNDFIEVFNFVTDKDKANLPTYKALEVAENVVAFGPEAKKSFLKGYEYGVSKKGLDISSNDAIEFGKTMASRSVKKEVSKI